MLAQTSTDPSTETFDFPFEMQDFPGAEQKKSLTQIPHWGYFLLPMSPRTSNHREVGGTRQERKAADELEDLQPQGGRRNKAAEDASDEPEYHILPIWRIFDTDRLYIK